MSDVFFKCRVCGKHLVVADDGVGLTVDCPDCHAAIAIPAILLVHTCPHCGQRIKSAAEMKGEIVICPACRKEFHVPGQPDSALARQLLAAFICPECHAEVEAPEQVGDQTSRCPNCGERVHLRHKLHLKGVSSAGSLFPAIHRRRRVRALAILVVLAALVLVAFLKIRSTLP